MGLLACMEMECIGIHCQMDWSVHMELEYIESFRQMGLFARMELKYTGSH